MNIITAEHIWFIITEISEASKCTDRVSLATAYFLTVYHEIFSIFPYSLPVAFSLAVLNTLLTCAWNFMDLFIILLSHALAMRFQQINHRLMGIRGKASLNNLCMVIGYFTWQFIPRVLNVKIQGASFLVKRHKCASKMIFQKNSKIFRKKDIWIYFSKKKKTPRHDPTMDGQKFHYGLLDTRSSFLFKVLPSSVWRQLRENYNELSCLTKLLDQTLSPIVLLSFANNLYFISLQLFNSLK